MVMGDVRYFCRDLGYWVLLGVGCGDGVCEDYCNMFCVYIGIICFFFICVFFGVYVYYCLILVLMEF